MMASALLLPSAALFPSMADAQLGAVVQAVPSEAAVGRLNSNLAKLSRAPQDVDALLGAAQAALDLGDVQAANGFFTRANLVNPNLPTAKLGLAVVELALKQPQEAAANFDAAESLGEHARGHLADRGLAYDLTGQQAKAQRDYQAALRENAGDTKARLRYAVSLGISGKLNEAEQLLEAPLRAGDREAWRFRAFIYAMNGKPTEAHNITQSVMPKGLADALEPYMVRVPLLTPAQKAAAAHYGDFPANVLRMTPPREQVVVAAAPQPQPVVPATKDDGKKSRNSRDRGKDSKQAAQTVFVTPTPTPQPTPSRIDLIPPPPPLSEPVQVARNEAAPVRPLISGSAPVIVPAQRTPMAQPLPQAAQPQIVAPPVRSTTLPSSTPARTQPFTQPTPSQPKAASERTLASALSSLTVPDTEKSSSTAAVDLNALAKAKADKAKKEAEAKAKAEKEAKAKAEAELKKKLKDNPSRIWVQIAAGKNEGALAFDLRRFRRTYAEAIGDESGWFTNWGATNRLLIGPYKKEERARTVISAIKKAGGDAFLWESEAGEEVKKIGAK
jgi:tetratricopeptide (TPR) repeat protein